MIRPDLRQGAGVGLDSSLDSLPIHRTSKPAYWVLVFPILSLAPVILAASLAASAHRPGDFVAMLLRPPFLLFIAPVSFAVIAIRAIRRRATLDIDRGGIRMVVNGKATQFGWADIASAQEMTGRYKRGCVRIRRKGEYSDNPKPTLVWPEFGLSTSGLLQIIEAGVTQWGVSGVNSRAPLDPAVNPIGRQKEATLRSLKWRTIAACIGIFAIPAGFSAYLSLTSAGSYFDDQILKSRGVEISGTATGQYVEYGRRGGHSTHLRYQFVLPDRSEEHGESIVPSRYAGALGTGSSVPIVYDPKKPARSSLNLGDIVHTRDVSSLLWANLFITIVLCGATAPTIWMLVKTYRTARRNIENEALNH